MSNLSAEEYLDEKVRPIYDPMLIKLILEKPNDPVILNDL